MSEGDWQSGGRSADDTPANGDRAAELPTGAAAGVSAYAVKLPLFEGPLDLLLHLIRQNDVDITDIPVAEIGAQYLAYLELMQELNLDIVGEYLVMAATLALIKSRMLLPPEPGEDDEAEIDPRAELVARLLEDQRVKEVAEGLSRRRWLGRDVFAPTGAAPPRPDEAEREIEVGLFELIDAFKGVLEGASDQPGIHEVEVETVTVRERMHHLMELLEERQSLEFMGIFEGTGGEKPSRTLLIATFLGMLALVRLSACRIYQGTNAEGTPEGPIRIRLLEETDSGDWRSHIPKDM